MPATDKSKSKQKEGQIFTDVKRHMDLGFQETDRRATGKSRIGTISFNEADELFRSWLDESSWPYDALLFDPRIFTFIFEKTSRLISNKPKGRLTPREGSDMLAAKINNSLLDYQWDNSNIGGSMLSKWSLMDINARKYGSSFALSRWRYETDKDDRVVFDGPDMQVLNNRDTAHDLSATAIENCNWFQVRQYVTFQDLQNVNDAARTGPVYKNLDTLREKISTEESSNGNNGGDNRSSNWLSRNRSISGLELDPVGKDQVFKTIEIVTEYRRDRWITIAPKHGVVIRDIDNPYANNEIPIIMLRYYQVDDDLYGLSEIEPVKGLQKAINALLCQYVDEINQQLYSPIAIGPGVRQHTLEWGKGARWIMNNPMQDFRLVESRSNAAQYFNNTYGVLVNAMMSALGESSLGVSNTQPYQTDKTATEVKALQLQRNARDNYNQIFLAESIKRQYMLWHSMNQVLLFADPKTAFYVIRVTGNEALRYFQQRGLDQVSTNTDMVGGQFELENILGVKDDPDKVFENSYLPKYPISVEEEGTTRFEPKLKMEEGTNRSAQLYVTPDDLKGLFDFSINVQSMQVSADEEQKQARQQAITMISTNPNVVQMLQQEGVKPKFKDLFVQWLEDLGFPDADRFFEDVPQAGSNGADPMAAIKEAASAAAQGGAAGSESGGAVPSGIPGGTNPNSGGESSQSTPFAINRDSTSGLGPVSPKAISQMGV